MKCWVCHKDGADADSTMGSMVGVPYHKSCVRCTVCGSEQIIWKLWRDKLEIFKCLECGWISIRKEDKWEAVCQ